MLLLHYFYVCILIAVAVYGLFKNSENLGYIKKNIPLCTNLLGLQENNS